MTTQYRTGRHVNHDPRSWNYQAPRGAVVASVLWNHRAPVLNQGDVGSCTGNAMAQLLNTDKFAHARTATGHGRKYLTEDDALALYSLATTLDDVQGQYPPDDTGSSGLAVAKAAQQQGFLSGYLHAFGLNHMLQALQLQPVIVGTNWYESMFTPDAKGVVTVSGAIAGGHEYLVLGADLTAKQVICLNSWGHDWGRAGRFKVSFNDFGKLLQGYGDVTVPTSV